jgi:hypothetical protein
MVVTTNWATLPRASFADQDGGKRLPSGRIRLIWAVFSIQAAGTHNPSRLSGKR